MLEADAPLAGGMKMAMPLVSHPVARLNTKLFYLTLSVALPLFTLNAALTQLGQGGAPRAVGLNSGQRVVLQQSQPADLQLVKSVEPAALAYHAGVTYTLVLTNAGASDAPDAALTDTLPAGVTFSNWITAPAGAAESGGVITWTGPLSAGTVLTFTFGVTHTGAYGEVVTNTAVVSANAQAARSSAVFTVADEPLAGLAASNSSPTLLGQATRFTGSITAGTNVFYTWDFGDTQIGLGLTTTHTYTSPGQYTSVLTAANAAGSAAVTTTVVVTRHAPAILVFPPAFKQAWSSWTGGGVSSFFSPSGAAVDAAGNIYVMDDGHSRIEKFDAAGGFLLDWPVNGPGGLAVGPDGNVYYSDYYGSRIQKFDASGNLLTQWGSAGAGNGQFMRATYLAVDGAGFVYVSDNDNKRVEKFDSAGNYVTQWGGFSGYPAGIAVSGAGRVYVMEFAAYRVRVFDTSGAALGQWGTQGAGNGQFSYYDKALAVDAAGNVYAASAGNNRLQQFSPDGVFLSAWGGAGAGNGLLNAPTGIAVSPSGDVVVADTNNNRVQIFSPDLPQASTAMSRDGSPAPFVLAVGVRAPDSAALTWTVSAGPAHGTAVVNPAAGFTPTLAYTPTPGYAGDDWFQIDVTDGELGDALGLSVTVNGPPSLTGTTAAGSEYSLITGTVSATDPNVGDALKYSMVTPPTRGAFMFLNGTAGQWQYQPANWTTTYTQIITVAVADSYGLSATAPITLVVSATNETPDFIPTQLLQWGSYGTGPGQFNNPMDVAVDPGGNVYVIDLGSRLQKFRADGTWMAQWGGVGSGAGQFSGPWGVAVDHNGDVYVADTGNSRVQKFTSAGAYLTQWPLPNAARPCGLATDGGQYVYAAWGGGLTQFTLAGALVRQIGGSGSGNGQFFGACNVAVDAAGPIYVADSGNNRIQKFAADGTYLAQWGTLGTGLGQFDAPRGLAIDAAGNVYVADSGNYRLQKFTPDGTYLLRWPDGLKPNGIDFGLGGELYVADDTHQAQAFSLVDAAISLTVQTNLPKTQRFTGFDPEGAVFTWTLPTLPIHGLAALSAVTGTTSTLVYTPNAGYTGPDLVVLRLDDGATTRTMTVSLAVATSTPLFGLDVQNSSPTVLGQPTAFTASLNAGVGASYFWDFGDGASASSSSPARTHVYPSAGSYTAVVTASNAANSLSASMLITITNLAPAANAGPDQNVFVADLVTLDGRGSTDPDGHTPLNYRWTQSGGPAVTLSNAGHITPTFTAPAAPTVLTFTLAVSDSFGLAGPSDSVVVSVAEIALNNLTAASSSPTTLGQTTAFTAARSAGSNVTYVWTFGDGGTGAGATTVHTYTAAGNYPAIVTATNSLGSLSAQTAVAVTNLAPVVNAGAAQTVSVSGLVTLNGGSSYDPDGHTPLTYQWTQTGGPAAALSNPVNVTATFTAPATPAVFTFTLAVTDARGLAGAPASVVINVRDVAVAGLSARSSSPTTLGQTTLFTGTLGAGTNVVYAWDFGDGQLTATALTSHLYAAAGLYRAVFTATNATNVITAAVPVTVTNLAPVTVVSPNQNVLPYATVTLTSAGSYDPDGHTPLIYQWTQTGGPALSLNGAATATLTFTAPAYNTILTFTLQLTDARGLAGAPASVVVTVRDVALTGLSAQSSSPTTLGQAMLFTGTVSAGTNVVYTWDFGDGQTAATALAAHTYAAAGLYTAVFTAANATNVVTAAVPVEVTNRPPVIVVSPNKNVLPYATVTLTSAGSYDPDGHTPLMYQWTQTGGPTMTLNGAATTTLTFTAPAYNTFLTFMLQITDARGLAGTPTPVSVSVRDEMITGLRAQADYQATLGQTTLFTGTVGTGTNVIYAWDFGDGQVVSTALAAHTYAAAGRYTAIFTATNATNVDATTVPVEIINWPPRADAGLDRVVNVGAEVTLDAGGSTDPDGHLPLTYLWRQTAGPTVTLSSPNAITTVFTAPLTAAGLAFSLVVTDARGLANTLPAGVMISVKEIAVAGLSVTASTPTVFGTPTVVTAAITAGTAVAYTYDFGDGAVLVSQAPTMTHTYANAGHYPLAVTAANSTNSLTAGPTVYVARPITGLSAAVLPYGCNFGCGLGLQAAVVGGDDVSYTWQPGAGFAERTGQTVYVAYPYGGFTATVTAVNPFGSASAAVRVDNQPMPLPRAALDADQIVVVSSPVRLDASRSFNPYGSWTHIYAGLGYRWYEAGQLLAWNGPAVYTVTAPATPGVITYSVSVRDIMGQVSPVTPTVTLTVVASAQAIAGLIARSSTPTLMGQTTAFTASVSAGTNVSYTWNFGDFTAAPASPIPVVQHAYDQPGTYTVTVTARNSLGQATATTLVTVANVPLSGLRAFASGPTVAGEYTSFRAEVAAGSNAVYTWNFGDGSAPLAGNPVMRRYPITAATYTVLVTATNSVSTLTATLPATVFVRVPGPTAVTISRDLISEGQPAGALVGYLGARDAVSETLTFTLAAGTGSDDNALFTIANGNELRAQTPFTYNTRSLYSVRVRAANAAGSAAETAIPLSILSINRPPTAILLSQAVVSESQPVWSTVGRLTAPDPNAGDWAYFTLVDGAGAADNLSFGVLGNLLQTRAVFTYLTQSTYHLRLRATDQSGLSLEQPFTLTVAPINHAPTGLLLSTSTVAEALPVGAVVGTFTAQDPDAGQTFTYALENAPGARANASFTVSGDQLRTNVVFDAQGQVTHPIAVKVTDPGGATFTRAFTLTVAKVNQPPVVRPDQALTVRGQSLVIPVGANDFDRDGGALTVTAVTQPAFGAVQVGGDQALDLTNIDPATAADNTLGALNGDLTLEAWINPRYFGPSGCANKLISKRLAPYGAPVQGYALCLSSEGPPDVTSARGNLTFSSDVGGAFSTGGLLTANTWTHVAVTQVTDPFRAGRAYLTTVLYINGQAVATDVALAGREWSNPAVPFQLGGGYNGLIDEVRVWNRALSAGEIAANMTRELSGGEPGLIAYYRFHETSGPVPNTTGAAGDLTLQRGATRAPSGWQGPHVLYTPPAGLTGPATFAYTLANGYGLTASTTVAVQTVAAGAAIAAYADTAATFAGQSVAIYPLANDTGAGLTLDDVSAPLSGTAVIDGNSILYTPAASAVGVDTFTYGSHNAAGAATGQIQVTVKHADLPPLAVDDQVYVWQDTPTCLDEIIANDRSAPGMPAASLQGASLPQSVSGPYKPLAGCQFSFNPAPGYSGQFRLSYQVGYWVNLTRGTFLLASTANMTVTVLPVRQPPVAVDDTFTLDRDTPLTLTVLANDQPYRVTDTLRVVGFGLPQNGALELGPAGDLIYRPYLLFTGTDTFLYTLEDQAGLRSTAQVTLTVRQVNTAPMPMPAVRFTSPGQPVVIDVGLDAYNPSGRPMIVDSYGPSPYGQVAWLGGTQFLFTPTVGYVGAASFTYTLRLKTPCEQTLAPLQAQAACVPLLQPAGALPPERLAPQAANTPQPGKGSIVIGSAAPGSMTAGPGAASAVEGLAAALNPLSAVSNPGGQNLALLGLQRRQGLLSQNPDNSLNYIPAPGFSGTDLVTYTISDGQGGVITVTTTVTVAAASRPPVAAPDFPSVTAETFGVIAVLTNDTNAAGGVLTVTAVTAPAHGAAGLNADNTVTYTPTSAYTGPDSLVYTVVNARGLAALGRVWVTVRRVNYPPVARPDDLFAAADQTTDLHVLVNDFDPNGDPLRIVSAAAVTGTVRISPLEGLLYTPPAGFLGQTTISYTVNDGDTGWASAPVTVTVAGAAPRVFAGADVYTPTIEAALAMPVLDNDQSDAAVPLSVTSFSQPGAGRVTVDPLDPNVLRCTLTAPLVAAETFTYTVASRYGQSTGTVTLWPAAAAAPSHWEIYLPVIVH